MFQIKSVQHGSGERRIWDQKESYKNSLLQFRIYLPNPYGTSLSNLYEFYIIINKKRKCVVVQSVKP